MDHQPSSPVPSLESQPISAGPLPADLLARVVDRLEVGDLNSDVRTAEDLARIYSAWCRHVPFDNLRKLVALASHRHGSSSAPELPGIHARDFFEHWLELGTGGTCWPSSHALLTLLLSLGFAARTVSASMADSGQHNHGTVIVETPTTKENSTPEVRSWLVDSSILSGRPVPIEPQRHTDNGDPINLVRLAPEPAGFVIWWTAIRPEPMPCRLLRDPVDHDFYRQRYEASRTEGLFNEVVCVHRWARERVTWIFGNQLIETSAAGRRQTALSPTEARSALVEHFGYRPNIVDRLDETHLAPPSFMKTNGPG